MKTSKLLLFILVAFTLLTVNAQIGNVTFTVRTESVQGWTSCNGQGNFTSFTYNINEANGDTATSGCQFADGGDGTVYAINTSTLSGTNLGGVIRSSMDAWEDNTGNRCAFEINNGPAINPTPDECRVQSSQTMTIKNMSLPSNGVFETSQSFLGNIGIQTYRLSATWKYVPGGDASLTPQLSCDGSGDTVLYSFISIPVWEVNMTAGLTYHFSTCGLIGEPTSIRIYAPDGYTLVAFDDDGCEQFHSLVEFTPESSGLHYVEVSGFRRQGLEFLGGGMRYYIVDPNPFTTTYYVDFDGDGFGSSEDPGIVSCDDPGEGFSTNNLDCNDANAAVNPDAAEVCNSIDDDCDGLVDAGDPSITDLRTFYWDNDQDGYGAGEPFFGCLRPELASQLNGDCNDSNPLINPGEIESCNGMDDDCDGLTEELLESSLYYVDNDGDGYGSNTDPGTTFCTDPGEGYSVNNLDCNDADAAINPGASETCNGVDDDCNGLTDEGLPGTTYYIDGDGDGYGSNSDPGAYYCADPGEGFAANNLDCNDADAAVNPSATEICNNIDDDCDGESDEDQAFTTYYVDSDGDGFGSAAVGGSFCVDPGSGFSTVNTDCNDDNAAVYPGATEIANGIDDDCDEAIDENTCTSKPARPASISGPISRVCLGLTSDYTVSPVAGATSYSWTVSGRATIVSGQGTGTITVNFPGTTMSTRISVRAVNACGQSQARVITVITNNTSCGAKVALDQTGEKAFGDLSLQVYPNPSKGLVTLQFRTEKDVQQVTLKLLDIRGREVLTRKLEVANNETVKLDLHNLPQGIYFLEAVSSDSRKVIKVVKN